MRYCVKPRAMAMPSRMRTVLDLRVATNARATLGDHRATARLSKAPDTSARIAGESSEVILHCPLPNLILARNFPRPVDVPMEFGRDIRVARAERNSW